MRRYFIKITFLIFRCLGIVNFLERFYFSSKTLARNKHGGLPILDFDKIDKSYLLISPFNTGDYKINEGITYLADLQGSLLHHWKLEHQASNSKLMPDGTLFVAQVLPDAKNTSHFPGGGRTGIIQQLDWQGNVLWEYKNDGMHHDFDVLPNGNIVVLVWEMVPKELTQELLKHTTRNDSNEVLWSDVVLEINKATKEIVWEWHAVNHLNTAEEPIGNFPYRVEWTHTNAVSYVPKNQFNGKEAFLLSMRNANRVILINQKTGKILWKTPDNMTLGQHDPTYLENGNILIFDNGLHRQPSSRSEVVHSRVIEVNPKTNNIEWSFEGGKTSSEKARFYSSVMCGAQRLKNGNTHITLSNSGHLFEITEEKKLVWDFICPFTTYGEPGLWPNNAIFNSRRYRKDEVDWPVKLPIPNPRYQKYSDLNC